MAFRPNVFRRPIHTPLLKKFAKRRGQPGKFLDRLVGQLDFQFGNCAVQVIDSRPDELAASPNFFASMIAGFTDT